LTSSHQIENHLLPAGLLHFLYRFAHVGTADMGFGPGISTPLSIGLHTLLSFSSLLFSIAGKRVKRGSMIWSEYRLHSIIFAVRSLLCMGSVWVQQQLSGEERMAPIWFNVRWVNPMIVLASMGMANVASRMVPPSGSTKPVGGGTIRDLDAPPVVRFFFSYMQFHATAGCLVGLLRYSTQFYYVWIIQFTAFLLTLRRKNLASHTALVTLYGTVSAPMKQSLVFSACLLADIKRGKWCIGGPGRYVVVWPGARCILRRARSDVCGWCQALTCVSIMHAYSTPAAFLTVGMCGGLILG